MFEVVHGQSSVPVQEVYSFMRAQLEENCKLWGTEHAFGFLQLFFATQVILAMPLSSYVMHLDQYLMDCNTIYIKNYSR